MRQSKRALPKNKNGNKPVQEALPSSKQQPMGDDNDLKKNDEYITEKDNNENNSVGIRRK